MTHNKGFTLIELITSLAVVAILSSMVITFSSAFMQDNRMSLANNDLVGSISLARSAAVSRGGDVTLCASSDGTSCTGTAWELGWIIFSDSSVNGVVDGIDQVLKVKHQVGTDISVTGGSNAITFRPTGTVASVCVDCLDKTLKQRLDNIFVAVIKNLSPVSLAYASGGSGSSGSSKSGSSGSSGSGPSAKCVAPNSQATSAGSGSSGGSGSSSASLSIEQTSDYALNVLQKLLPIASAHASGSSGSSASSGGSGSSGSGSSAGGASCDFGNGVQAALPSTSFLICDSMRSGESGNFVSVSAVGRVSRTKVFCN